MKQIIPFKKELLFKTKVSEITSISLEHTLTLQNDDLISGEFHISGDYKMTEGSINREKFQFKLPFDIALDSRYDMSSIIIDIDNFYYEIINNESLKVNIDVYVEGEKIKEPETEKQSLNQLELLTEEPNEEVFSLSNQEEPFFQRDETTLEVEEKNLNEPLVNQSEPLENITRNIHSEFEQAIQTEIMPKAILEPQKKINLQDEFNLSTNMDNSDTYVTYYVYVVKEEDTIEKILTKYEVSKEELSLYNDIESLKPGTKLIIPSHCNE